MQLHFFLSLYIHYKHHIAAKAGNDLLFYIEPIFSVIKTPKTKQQEAKPEHGEDDERKDPGLDTKMNYILQKWWWCVACVSCLCIQTKDFKKNMG